MTKPPPKRLFIALDLSIKNKHIINNWLQQNVQLSKPATQLRNWHLTLAFLGQVPEQDELALCQLLAQCPMSSFALNFEKHDFWAHNGLFHLTPSAPYPQLQQLAQWVMTQAASLGYLSQYAQYRPHITLARSLNSEPQVTNACPSFNEQITHFSMYESTRDELGLVYNELKRFSLV